MVGLAYRFAAASPHITAVVIEATEFPDLAARYRVSGVPKTVVNETVEIMGPQPEDMLVQRVLEALAEEPAE